jgi:amidophosphoribosyltransferase
MCGLIGVVGTQDSAYEVFLGLMNLQHRGQDGAGILTIDHQRGQFSLQKGSGLVENVFSERSFRNLKGLSAVGHARYATIGRRDPNMLQPFLDSATGIAIAHNGNIVNCYSLREELLARHPETLFATESDSEVILKLIAEQLIGKTLTKDALFEAVGKVMQMLVGSYSIVGLMKDGSLFGFRDPDGIRPLELGHKDRDGKKAHALASETVALHYLEYNNTEEIKPGEAVIIGMDGSVTKKMLHKRSYSPCMFEWVYFARVESTMGEMSVYQARFRLGQILAEELERRGVQADLVLPVPETSRIAAIAISEKMNLPFRELLIKNRYVNRTFILDDQESRQEAIKRKLFPISHEIKGKRCLVVDDSIVRGNTAVQLIKLIRQAGASEVIVVSTCPPIASPCYYGIDFPSPKELVAYNRSEEEIAKYLGADRVIYQTVEGLQKALEQASLCTGCLTQKYPTDVSCGADFENRRTVDREKQGIGTGG